MKTQCYIPMSCRVLTVGHIKVLEHLLSEDYFIYVGLLTEKAMKGYKKEVMDFEDRKYILETVAMALGNIDVVPQDSLDPSENIRKYKCRALASGDGFEPVELEAIRKYKLKRIDVKLRGEKAKTYSSSNYLK